MTEQIAKQRNEETHSDDVFDHHYPFGHIDVRLMVHKVGVGASAAVTGGAHGEVIQFQAGNDLPTTLTFQYNKSDLVIIPETVVADFRLGKPLELRITPIYVPEGSKPLQQILDESPAYMGN